jgi:hypothetical protein
VLRQARIKNLQHKPLKYSEKSRALDMWWSRQKPWTRAN